MYSKSFIITPKLLFETSNIFEIMNLLGTLKKWYHSRERKDKIFTKIIFNICKFTVSLLPKTVPLRTNK